METSEFIPVLRNFIRPFLSFDVAFIIEKLTEFRSDTIEIATLYIPHIHCSSCIWILENLKKLIEVDYRSVADELDNARAPWTPGRIPKL